MGTGLIVAFVVAVWAAYFVPLVLRRYDEASTSSSLETLSPLSRVISRPESPATVDAEPDQIDDVVEVEAPAPEPESSPPISGRAARIAARRRRRTLLTLLTATAIVGGLAGFVVIPMWSVAIPAGLVVTWLVTCRIQVRRERGISRRSRRKTRSATSTKAPVEEEDTVITSVQMEDANPARHHVMESAPLEADALDEKLVIAAPSVATTGDLVWDPLPVTLPTYVTKPRAGRTVRTIDFAQPGAWTSGHVEGEDVELPSRDQASEEAQRRAANE